MTRRRYGMKSKTTFFLVLVIVGLICAQPASADVTGDWHFTRDGSAVLRVLHLKQSGSSVSGKIPSPGGDIEILAGYIRGDHLEFLIRCKMRNGTVLVTTFVATVSGDVLQGTTKTASRFPRLFTATRR